MKTQFKILFLGAFLTTSLFAVVPVKPFSLDFGAGIPQLAAVQGAFKISHWQFGAAYGLLGLGGGAVSPTFKLPAQNVSLKNQEFVTFDEPHLTPTFSSVNPFLRYFPNESNFYFQLMLGMMKVSTAITSTISDVTGTQIPDASFAGTINLTQFLPTLSIGNTFSSELFFFNVTLGVTFVANASVEVSSSGVIPDRLGGTSSNQDVIDGVGKNITDAVNKATTEFREQVLCIPSIQLTFGITF